MGMERPSPKPVDAPCPWAWWVAALVGMSVELIPIGLRLSTENRPLTPSGPQPSARFGWISSSVNRGCGSSPDSVLLACSLLLSAG